MTTIPFAISDRLTERFPLEYLEAVAEQSLAIQTDQPQDTLIAVNPRGIVAIVDRQANQAALVPTEHLWKALGALPHRIGSFTLSDLRGAGLIPYSVFDFGIQRRCSPTMNRVAIPLMMRPAKR